MIAKHFKDREEIDMKIKNIFLLFTLIFIPIISHATTNSQTKIIIFGDSLSDAGLNQIGNDSGNNTWAKNPGHTGAPFTNIDPTTNTRPLWINYFFAKKFPDQIIWPIRIAKQNNIDLTNNSLNYAFASAETGANYLDDQPGNAYPPYVSAACHAPGNLAPGLYCVPSVLKQIDLYLSDVRHPDDKTTFIIWAGGNDIFNNVAKLISLLNQKKLTDFSNQLINTFSFDNKNINKDNCSSLFPPLSHPVINLIRARDKLIAAGVKPEQIYFINLPDLAKSPAAIKLAKGSDAVLNIVHGISLLFNSSLELGLTKMPFSENNLLASHIISAYDLLNEVMIAPTKFTFTKTTQSCVAENATPYCKGYMFFNDKHPTTKIGELLADKVLNAI